QVFSDICYVTNELVIEGNAYFKQLHKEYPDSYFIFNDRPIDNWIRSRINHINSKGSLLNRFSSALKIPPEAVPDYWRQVYAAFKEEVISYFGVNSRFMIFDVENDAPEQLAAFLAEDFP